MMSRMTLWREDNYLLSTVTLSANPALKLHVRIPVLIAVVAERLGEGA